MNGFVGCREVADDSKVQSDGTSLTDKPEIILERLGFARPRQQQLVCTAFLSAATLL